MELVILDNELLIKEIVSWSEKDQGVLGVLEFVSRLGSPENGQVEDTYYNFYKHLGIFSEDKKLNDKGLAIVQILREK